MSEALTIDHPTQDAGWVQGILLALMPAMMVMAIAVMLPVIPGVLHAFSHVPNIADLVPLSVVLPTVAIALTGIVAGVVGERVGRRRLLNISTTLFALTAVLPFWLTDFTLILIARTVTGVALGGMLTSGVGLTGDYFSGLVRQRWLAVQGGIAAGTGVVVSVISGALGEINWRMPFLLLLSGGPLLLALILFPGPARGAQGQGHDAMSVSDGGDPTPWTVLAVIFVLTVVASLLIYPPPYEISVLLEEKALGSSMVAGLTNALLAAGAVGGAMGLTLLRRFSSPAKLAMAIAVAGAGTLVIWAGGSLFLVMLGATTVGVGEGMAGPVLSVWVLDRASVALRGRVVGLYQTIYHLAQFAAPLLARWIAARSGGANASLFYYGLATAALVALITAGLVRGPGALVRASG